MAEIVKLDQPQLKMSLGVPGHVLDLLLPQLPVKLVLARPSLFVVGQPEVVNQEASPSDGEAQGLHTRTNAFVHPAHEENLREAPEQAHVFMVHKAWELPGLR